MAAVTKNRNFFNCLLLLGTPASSTTKTGRHDIAESGVKHQKSLF
jgi:hypothetical protein